MNASLSRRIEGPDKVFGRARYVDDIKADVFGSDFDHAVVVTSTIALGRISEIETDAALALPDVVTVVTHQNAPKLHKIFSPAMAELADHRPLQDDQINHYGQPIALVIARTPKAAAAGAAAVKVMYTDVRPPAVTLEQGRERLAPVKRAGMARGKIKSGNAAQDFAASPVKVDEAFHNAPHHHNTMEPGSAIARWDADGGVTIQAAVQWHHIETMAIGQMFGLGPREGLPGFLGRKLFGTERAGLVRLNNTLAGGAFGRNLNMVHIILACIAAKVHEGAVKLTVTRGQCFTLFTFRAEVAQRVQLGADEGGKLRSILVDPQIAAGVGGAYVEPVGSWSCHVYDHESRFLEHKVARLDTQNPGWMRAPGGSSAMFALESAMDQMAHEIGVDPVDLRLHNFAERDPESGKDWHSNQLRACYEQGMAAIGWRDRPKGGSVRADGRLSGFGMASAYEVHFRFPASVRVILGADGRAVVKATVAEMGQGAWAALTTQSAQYLGLDRDAVSLDTNTTDLPSGAGSIASTGTYSNAASIHEAAQKIRKDLLAFATSHSASPLSGAAPDDLSIADGVISGPDNRFMPVADLMALHPEGKIEASATSGRNFGMSKKRKATFGACFVEIAVDPITYEISVEHIVGAYAGGRIIEPVIARNQISGGLIWGLGQALMEESVLDPRTGRWVNGNLAEALIPTQADVGKISVITVEDDDPSHPVGMKGLSEIGVMGPGPAIANAVFDALGKRVRKLPVRLDDLMEEMP